VAERPAAASSTELVEDLFRKEYAHLVSALVRVLGPSNIPLAEDVVHDALVSAMHAWRFGLPQDPKAWIIRAAHNRAVDIIRREQRGRSFLPELAMTTALTDTIEAALAPAAESASQLAMMFAVCDPSLNRETHVTLVLRWLCGLSPKEIGQAFLIDTQTIDRRLHRGRGRLRQLGRLPDVDDLPDIDTRRESVLRSLYLLFNEGYHGSNPQVPIRPFLCEDALHLTELLLDAKTTAYPEVHALAALFCFDAARLSTRLDEHGVFVPLEDQDRSRWDRTRIERGLMHLSRSAIGDHMSRWHLEAGIACEHAIAPSVELTDWDRIVGFYQVLAQQSWSPIVALNRALAVAERDGVDEGRRELIALAGERKLSLYPFYWAARADLDRRSGCNTTARENYERAIALARSRAERVSFERRIELLEIF
jgi:RNA polymerase sigma-70 factor (ECF subfamily)